MNTTIKTGLAAILLLAVSCKKENNTTKSSLADKSSTPELITDISDPGINSFITIGTQKWMTKNLSVTRYRNGDKIPQVKRKADWKVLTTGAWCWYNNDSATGATYGKLYNWYAVNDPRGLAPTGWHVPSDAEWDILSTYLGGDAAAAGGKMKETGTAHWIYPNTDATNSSGFTGLPGGVRIARDGTFNGIGYQGFWWSSTQDSATTAWNRFLIYNNGLIGRPMYGGLLGSGISVRCIKD